MARTRYLSLPLAAQAELERRKRKAAELVEAGVESVTASDLVLTGRVDYSQYQQDPVAFGVEVLGEHYAPDVVDVMQSILDNTVTVARSANATGKSHGAARIAVWFYKCFPGAQVYTTAAPPEANLRRILWGEIGSIINKHPAVFQGDKVNSLEISRSPQEFITGVTIPMAGTPEQREAKFNGKHAPYLLFIVDEGDAVPPEVYRGIEACMSGGMARLLVMFNPRGKQGPVYQMERDRLATIKELSAIRHPNVITGNDIIPGAVTREKTVRRFNEWSRPLIDGEHPDTECVEVPDFLVGCVAKGLGGEEYPPLPAGWRKVTNPALFYMVLGQYPAQSELQLISRAWIEAAVSRWQTYVAINGEIPPLAVSPVLGVDVAEFGKDKNVLCPRYGGWVPRFTHVWSGVDPDTSAIRAAKVYEDLDAWFAAVDATGVGAGVPARMERLGCNAEGIKVASSPTTEPADVESLGEFGMMRDQLWWAVREWLRLDPGAMLPPDDELMEELAVPSYGIVSGKIRVTDKDTMRELLGRSPDKGDSLCLTFAPTDGGTLEVGTNPLQGYRG